MSSISTVPPEIIAIILQEYSNFQNVTSLVSTCKRLHSIWISELSKSVIWSVGCRLNLAFDVALLAVGQFSRLYIITIFNLTNLGTRNQSRTASP